MGPPVSYPNDFVCPCFHLRIQEPIWVRVRQEKVRAANSNLRLETARRGLEMVRQGEEDTISGWVMYGEELLKCKRYFSEGNDKGFGQWKHKEGLCDSRCEQCKLVDQVDPVKPYHLDGQAALWAAQEPEELLRILEEYPKVRTVRGAKAKFGEENKPVRGLYLIFGLASAGSSFFLDWY
jgi:hypothetical protein